MLRRHPPQLRRPATSVLALASAAALFAFGSPASAAPADPAPRTEAPRAGALPLAVTPARRASLIGQAQDAQQATARRIGLGPREQLLVKDVIQDADGTLHTRYERTFAGLPVVGGDLVVHDAKGRTTVSRASGAQLTVASLTPSVRATGAAKAAVTQAERAEVERPEADSPRLVIRMVGAAEPVLAWETLVKGVQEDGTPSELRVLTDAASGKVLSSEERVHTGRGTGQYNGEVSIGTTPSESAYQMVDGERAGHRTYDLEQRTSGTGTLFTDADDVWGDGTPANRQTAGVDVAFGAGATWDFYQQVFGRNGIRDDGVAAYSRAHYGNNYVNAFWSDSCFCMTYGDGAGNTHPLTALDVAAHEMTHGVTSATANLTYAGESGGLNEATSDIFAAAVEFHSGLAADPGDYLVGEKIDIRGNGTPLRYMDRPSRDGLSRDYWDPSLGGVDVHYSSGPANHFFYLLAEGSGPKTVNDVAYDSPTFDGLPVAGIGIEDASRIWYRALTTYMTSGTDYAGARTATLQATADLFGAYSPRYLAVADAWAGVNVGDRIALGVNAAPIPDQTSGIGQAVGLQVDAFTTNTGSALTFEATGLPDGLTLSADGLVSGTPTTIGTSEVSITVRDDTGSSVTLSFTWQVAYIYAATTRVDIPDNGAAVESPLTITDRPGNAAATTRVHVKITHTYRGDLTVDLVGPDGTAYPLLNRSGGPADNVDQTFTVDASAQPIEGTWKLRVQDRAALDVGYVERWELTP
ncbi:M4 family metallopeptidase [Streptomyces sp. IBSNAI002]|uniref:M4 family metallopeptidase n=1 Tax=Streptomyces sp. IBSNAI002 TaxID=3457500 RepID=UPI003FD4FF0F